MAAFRFIFLIFLLVHGAACVAEPAVALHYGAQAPLAEMRVFDIVVVDPDHNFEPRRQNRPDSELYAYASVGEANPGRAYFAALPDTWKMARNGDWGSVVIDQTPAAWPDFFAERVIGPLWDKGYRGFFLDTLDSYRLAAHFDEAAQRRGLIAVIETLHRRFPGIRLILNRGFDIVPQVRDKIAMVAAESLFRGWNAKARLYQEVTPADREWLLGQLNTIHQRDGLPILVIDYVPPRDRAATRATAERISALGFIPWVTDSALATLGIGAVEAVPRRILVLRDGAEAPAVNYSDAHRYLEMPLNHLGYVVDYADVQETLPQGILADRYAGIVTWFSGSIAESRGKLLARWLQARIEDGLPVAVIGNFGFNLNRGLARQLQLSVDLPLP